MALDFKNSGNCKNYCESFSLEVPRVFTIFVDPLSSIATPLWCKVASRLQDVTISALFEVS